MADIDFNLTPAHKPGKAKKAQTPINLASLPREEALRRARIAGRAFLEDPDALREGFREIGEEWLNANMPIADGQTDDEFGELGDALEAEFTRALSAGLQKSQARSGDEVSFKFPESVANRLESRYADVCVLLDAMEGFLGDCLSCSTEEIARNADKVQSKLATIDGLRNLANNHLDALRDTWCAKPNSEASHD